LDVSKATALEALYCNSNKINTLDLSKNIALKTLTCSSNQLVSLNISGTSLTGAFGCSNNLLSSLDVSEFTGLWRLLCSNNKLNFLDMGKNCTDVACDINLLNKLTTTSSLTILSCSQNQLNDLDVSKCVALNALSCFDNKLSSLDLNNNIDLWFLSCYNNRLLLSNLYNISEIMKTTNKSYSVKQLGTQRLIPQTVFVDDTVDFSSQATFGSPDTLTVFYVEKDSISADSVKDYIIENGVFTFYTLGTYTITMTNDAIISDTNYPAKVIAEIIVSNVGIVGTYGIHPIQIYPNPTDGKLHITISDNPISDNPTIEIYDIVGKLQHSEIGK
jgi:hypothetical protein